MNVTIAERSPRAAEMASWLRHMLVGNGSRLVSVGPKVDSFRKHSFRAAPSWVDMI